jgi:hypothetical protein
LGVKETRITDGGRPVRYLLCRDTERVAEDQAVRQEIVARLQEELEGSRTAEAHTRKACTLLAHRGYARYLRETEKGGLEIDWGRVRDDERFDGKYVLLSNEMDLEAGELVLGYRDMWRAERAFRSMKSVLRMEPVYFSRFRVKSGPRTRPFPAPHLSPYRSKRCAIRVYGYCRAATGGSRARRDCRAKVAHRRRDRGTREEHRARAIGSSTPNTLPCAWQVAGDACRSFTRQESLIGWEATQATGYLDAGG